MIIFADKQTHNQSSKQILNSKTEAHSYPLWIVGERANYWIFQIICSSGFSILNFALMETIIQ